jgi:transcriptional regulator
MYLPKHFNPSDDDRVRKLIEQNGFATVLSFPKDSKPFINHLPVIYSSNVDEEHIIIGHMAKRNPQWMHFKENPECTLIINGAHTYISPRWYKSGRDVPTWNYAVAHLHGRIELIDSFNGQVSVLKQLSNHFEKQSPTPWEFELPSDLLDETSLCSAIISFKFHTEKVDAKFKFSQNRSQEDKAGVIDGLERERTDDMSRTVREIMLEYK